MRTQLRGDNHADTRERNLRMVLRSLSTYGPLSRRQISELSGLAPGTISGLVGDLLERGILVTAGLDRPAQSRGGPSMTLLDFNPAGVAVIGAALGVYGRAVNLCDPRGHVLAHRYLVDYTTRGDIETQIEWIAQTALELIDGHGLTRSAIIGIGVGAEGRVVPHTGNGSIIPYGDWREYPIERELERMTGLPVVIASAIHADAAGEIWFGAGTGVDHWLFVSIGTTLGVAAAVGNKIVRGHGNLGGDFSHIVVNPGGPRCICGKRGCLETVAGVQSIRAFGQEFVRTGVLTSMTDLCGGDAASLTSEMVAQAAGEGDPAAVRIISRAASYVAKAIAPVVASIGPEVIVLHGEVPRRSAHVMLDVINEEIAKLGLQPGSISPKVAHSRISYPPGTELGGAALALDRFFFTPQLVERGSPGEKGGVSILDE